MRRWWLNRKARRLLREYGIGEPLDMLRAVAHPACTDELCVEARRLLAAAESADAKHVVV